MPRIGLLSDSHGRASTTRRAVDLLRTHGAQWLIHLGDVGTVEVIDALVVEGRDGQPIDTHLVFGNTDWDAAALGTYARDLGVQVHEPFGRVAVEGGDLLFCHGHEPAVMADALAQKVKYLCHGHTHRPLDARRGATRIINPGALFRAPQYTVAVLDTAGDDLAFYSLPDRG